MTTKNDNSLLLETLGAKPIAFNPMLARLADSALAGLFLSQMLYWRGKGHTGDWVYKTIKEMRMETGMIRSEQDRAIKIWKRLGILEVGLWGIPRKRYFRINWEKLLNLLKSRYGKDLLLRDLTDPFAEFGKLDGKYGRTITESTQRITIKDSPCRRPDDTN